MNVIVISFEADQRQSKNLKIKPFMAAFIDAVVGACESSGLNTKDQFSLHYLPDGKTQTTCQVLVQPSTSQLHFEFDSININEELLLRVLHDAYINACSAATTKAKKKRMLLEAIRVNGKKLTNYSSPIEPSKRLSTKAPESVVRKNIDVETGRIYRTNGPTIMCAVEIQQIIAKVSKVFFAPLEGLDSHTFEYAGSRTPGESLTIESQQNLIRILRSRLKEIDGELANFETNSFDLFHNIENTK